MSKLDQWYCADCRSHGSGPAWYAAHDCPGRKKQPDPVAHPQHYTSHPSGIECIQVTEAASFNVGNAIKYLWRVEWGDKGTDKLEDLRKAAWYVQREIERRQREPQT